MLRLQQTGQHVINMAKPHKPAILAPQCLTLNTYLEVPKMLSHCPIPECIDI